MGILAKTLPPNVEWTANAAGVPVHIRTANMMKAAGVRRGWPDLQFLFPDGVTRFVELKAGASLSSEQRAFRDRCQAIRPDLWAVCRSVDEVADTLRAWGVRLRATTFTPNPIAREDPGQP